MSQPSTASKHEEPPADGAVASGIPLFVDLDGTLIASDVTHESVLASIKRDPVMLLRIPVLALRGRGVMKRELAERVTPDVRLLPYRHEVLNYLREQRWAGRRVILATASDRRYADAIAKELGLFDDVIATDGELNLKGPNKLRDSGLLPATRVFSVCVCRRRSGGRADLARGGRSARGCARPDGADDGGAAAEAFAHALRAAAECGGRRLRPCGLSSG